MRFIVALAALALVAATGQSLADSGTQASSGSVTVPIAAQNGSGETGTATLSATANNKTQVVISLKGEPQGAIEPAHIHPGTCKKLDPKPAFPLTSVADGTSTSIVDAPLTLLQTGKFAINLHESTSNITNYVACGNIPATVTPMSSPASSSTSMPSGQSSGEPRVR